MSIIKKSLNRTRITGVYIIYPHEFFSRLHTTNNRRSLFHHFFVFFFSKILEFTRVDENIVRKMSATYSRTLYFINPASRRYTYDLL